MQFSTSTTRPLRRRSPYGQPSRIPAIVRAAIIFLGISAVGTGGYRLLRSHSAVSADIRSAPADRAHAATVAKKTYRVGIQSGHWKTEEVPDELNKLYWDTGTSADGYNEWEVNLNIAQQVAAILEKDGVSVDLLPATVPVDYKADAFVAIHADGNDDDTVNGYKVTPSVWDTDGKAESLSSDIVQEYGADTALIADSPYAVSDDMTQYYAFNFAKYQHSIDPATPGVIVEVGYLTNAADRVQITDDSQRSAQGIADGILSYLHLDTP